MSKKKIPFLYKIGLCVIVGLIFGNLLKSYVFYTSYVIGSSMQPTFYDGDIVGISKIAKPHRGDVVIARVEGKDLIKRCIGVSGDTIQIVEGVLYLNGEEYIESYIKDSDTAYYSGIASEEIELGINEYFILGDNRTISKDSREFGTVTRKQIIGVVTCSISE